MRIQEQKNLVLSPYDLTRVSGQEVVRVTGVRMAPDGEVAITVLVETPQPIARSGAAGLIERPTDKVATHQEQTQQTQQGRERAA